MSNSVIRTTPSASPDHLRIRGICAGLAAAGLVASLALPSPSVLAAEPAPEIYARDVSRNAPGFEQPGQVLNDASAIAVTTPMKVADSTGGLRITAEYARPVGAESEFGNLLATPKAVATSCYDFGPYGNLLNIAAGVAFPPAVIGKTASMRKLTLTNTGEQAVGFSGMATTLGDFTAVSTCGGSLGAGESCTIDLGFAPNDPGVRTGELVIPVDQAQGPVLVPLTGKAATGITAYRYPNCIEFPPTMVGSASSAQFWWYPDRVYISNWSSYGDLVVSGSPDTLSFKIRSSTCTDPVPPDYDCQIVPWFTPKAAGPIQGNLYLPSNADTPLEPVILLGTGIAEPQGTLSKDPRALNFGQLEVGKTSDPQSVTITNTSFLTDSVPFDGFSPPDTKAVTSFYGPPVRIDSVTIDGDYAMNHDCTHLDAGASCTINVTFTPTAAGDRPGYIQVNSDATNKALGISLAGTGSQPAVGDLVLSAYSVSFGSGVMGRPAESQVITLRNIGGADVRLLGMYITGDFSFTNDCPAALPPAGTCKATISFQPSIPGARTGKFVVNSSDTPGTDEAALAGNGCRPFGPPNSRVSDPGCS